MAECQHRELHSHIDDKGKTWWICNKCPARFARDKNDGELKQIKEDAPQETIGVMTNDKET